MLDARIRRFAVGEATIWRTSSAVAVTLTAVASSGTRLAVGGMMAARWITTSTPARAVGQNDESQMRSEEHTSELQSLMRISYAVFCLKKKKREHYTRKTNVQQKYKYCNHYT